MILAKAGGLRASGLSSQTAYAVRASTLTRTALFICLTSALAADGQHCQSDVIISPTSSTAFFSGKLGMEWDDYLRQQASMYRQLAEKAEDAVVKQELLELADVCEEVANNIEDRLTSG
jgi:hypothetical protein